MTPANFRWRMKHLLAVTGELMPSNDLDAVAHQESILQFDRFDAVTAWEIGCWLKEVAEKRCVAIAIEIRLGTRIVFSFAMNGTSPDNLDWLRRKFNVVDRFHLSSYSVGLGLQLRDTNLNERYGLPVADFAPHGGCFPIRLKGSGVVGAIGVSGLAQREDHELVVEAISSFLGIEYPRLALASG